MVQFVYSLQDVSPELGHARLVRVSTVRDRHLEYEKSFTRDRIRSTDTVLKANASGVRIWHKCS